MMFGKEIREQLRSTDPESFAQANQIFLSVLRRNQIFVRCHVWQPKNPRQLQFSEVDVVQLTDLADVGSISTRLKFRCEMDMWENKTPFADASLFIAGPTWEGKAIGVKEMIEKFAVDVANESRYKPGWKESFRAFAGYVGISSQNWLTVPAHHSLILPILCMSYGTFRTKYEFYKAPEQATRKAAVLGLLERFGSLVAQAQRENARHNFGMFLPEA